MNSLLNNSVFFGIAISCVAYCTGLIMKKKFKSAIFNPLLISIVLTIVVLLLLDIDYSTYNEGGKYVGYLMTPATVCLAIPLYQQTELLKKNVKAIIIGIVSGVITSLFMVFVMSLMFSLTHEQYVTLLPKSITSAIGMGISEELGGYPNITLAIIVITGVIGNMIAEGVCKLFKITNPVAKGVAIGTSSHAAGTAKAIEMGEVEGAMSGLSIAVAGVITVIFAGVFANFI